jgi:hypothetical protein
MREPEAHTTLALMLVVRASSSLFWFQFHFVLDALVLRDLKAIRLRALFAFL